MSKLTVCTLKALKMIIGGVARPPALMNVTTVVFLAISLHTVWKQCSPVILTTYLCLGTSPKPNSSMFHILLGSNSNFHLCSHCWYSLKNLFTWTGFAAIAHCINKLTAIFFLTSGCLL